MKQVLFNIQRVFHTSEEEMEAIERVMQVTFLEKKPVPAERACCVQNHWFYRAREYAAFLRNAR